MSSKVFDIVELSDLEDGKKYGIRLELPIDKGWIDDVEFCIDKGNETLYVPLKFGKIENEKACFFGEVDLNTRAIYRYYFRCKLEGKRKFITKNNVFDDNLNSRSQMWKMSVNYKVPDWTKGKIMYHIFVDRFNKGRSEELIEMPRRSIHKSWDEEMVIGPDKDGIWNNDFYGGDLKGIIDKLDYIESLGVSILYLSPIMWSQSNHRYDTGDYENVDPYAGCNEDLKLLCDEAHKRGMKVILDAVFNHTGNDSKYFNEYGTFDTVGAYQSPYSTYAPFYRKKYSNGKVYYDYWWGMPNLPVCNGYSRDWQEYICGVDGVIDRCFNLGIDGLRLDVADELTDEYIELIRKAVKRNKEDGFIIGEVWEDPMRMGRGYIEDGKGMDSVMNYNFLKPLIRYFRYGEDRDLYLKIDDIMSGYPDDVIFSLMNFTSTHDMTRGINLWDPRIFKYSGKWPWDLSNDSHDFCKRYMLDKESYERAKAVYEAYVFTLTFFPGILSIFYGDEVGVQGIGNLVNRKTFPWGKEDEDLLNFFRYMGRIRKDEPFLEQAGIKVLDINDRMFMFERLTDNEKALIAVNRTDQENDFIVPSEYNGGKVYSLKRSTPGHLNPYGGVAIKSK